MPETVWAIHNFEAEAEDEISFNIGEPIIVLQKDELYQDGWWEVRAKTCIAVIRILVALSRSRCATWCIQTGSWQDTEQSSTQWTIYEVSPQL